MNPDSSGRMLSPTCSEPSLLCLMYLADSRAFGHNVILTSFLAHSLIICRALPFEIFV